MCRDLDYGDAKDTARGSNQRFNKAQVTLADGQRAMRTSLWPCSAGHRGDAFAAFPAGENVVDYWTAPQGDSVLVTNLQDRCIFHGGQARMTGQAVCVKTDMLTFDAITRQDGHAGLSPAGIETVSKEHPILTDLKAVRDAGHANARIVWNKWSGKVYPPTPDSMLEMDIEPPEAKAAAKVAADYNAFVDVTCPAGKVVIGCGFDGGGNRQRIVNWTAPRQDIVMMTADGKDYTGAWPSQLPGKSLHVPSEFPKMKFAHYDDVAGGSVQDFFNVRGSIQDLFQIDPQQHSQFPTLYPAQFGRRNDGSTISGSRSKRYTGPHRAFATCANSDYITGWRIQTQTASKWISNGWDTGYYQADALCPDGLTALGGGVEETGYDHEQQPETMRSSLKVNHGPYAAAVDQASATTRNYNGKSIGWRCESAFKVMCYAICGDMFNRNVFYH